MRYLTPYLQKDLLTKPVLLAGPRQCGKTTLAKALAEQSTYLNWDIRKDKLTIKNRDWPQKTALLILDELHKMQKWKNYLKDIIDSQSYGKSLLVTGSAKLDVFRKSGDALTGRTFYYRLHPIDLEESKIFLPRASAQQRLEHLLNSGGFPEALLRPHDAERLRNDRFSQVTRDDVADISKTSAITGIEYLIELLRERVGSAISYANLAGDLGVSPATVKSWVEILEKLYIIFLVRPYSNRSLARAIRKEPKVYFFDCAAAYEDKTAGARLENLVASCILKQCHLETDTTGVKTELHYFRDRDNHEVDFVITRGRKIWACIEVKQSDNQISLGMKYAVKKLKPIHALQLVQNLAKINSTEVEYESQGIQVCSLARRLDSLSEIFASSV